MDVVGSAADQLAIGEIPCGGGCYVMGRRQGAVPLRDGAPRWRCGEGNLSPRIRRSARHGLCESSDSHLIGEPEGFVVQQLTVMTCDNGSIMGWFPQPTRPVGAEDGEITARTEEVPPMAAMELRAEGHGSSSRWR